MRGRLSELLSTLHSNDVVMYKAILGSYEGVETGVSYYRRVQSHYTKCIYTSNISNSQ